MNEKRFRVYFSDGFSKTVKAMSADAAKILAGAEQIKAGRTWAVTDIKELKDR